MNPEIPTRPSFFRHGASKAACPKVICEPVVFVVSTSKKGTVRSGQEYESPLLVLTGTGYAAMPFQVLHDRLCTALRGTKPRVVMEVFGPDSTTTLVFEDGCRVPGPSITK